MRAITLAIFVIGSTLLRAQSDTAEAQRNPLAGDAGAITSGKILYDQTCQNCHGASATGDRGPALTGTLRRGDADGMIFTNIRSGIRGTAMPPFSGLTTEQTWQLVSYIRSLSFAGKTESKAEIVKGDPGAGKLVFEAKGGCHACHQVNGDGTAVGPDLSNAGRLPAETIRAKIENPTPSPMQGRGRRRGPPAPVAITVKTKDGQEYRGLRRNEDSLSVQMIDMNGQYHSFEKAQLADFRVEKQSLMPGDFASKLSVAEMDNVVAWLKTLNTASAAGSAGGLSWERVHDSEKEPQNWLSYWGDLGGRHFSALNQITAANVKNLQAKWAVQMPGDGIVESVPVVVDGILYTWACRKLRGGDGAGCQDRPSAMAL